MAESTLKSPPSRGFRINPILVIVALIVLAIVAVVAIDVIHILEGGNQESIIYRAGDAILKFVFEPNSRVAPENIVICHKDSACSTTHAFIFSALVLFVVITGFAYTTLLERRFIA